VAEQIREALKILRRKQLEARLGLSRSTIYAMVAANELPPPIRLGNGRAVGWIEGEIDAWLAAQVERSRRDAA
jgi:prophage regulatory protein